LVGAGQLACGTSDSHSVQTGAGAGGSNAGSSSAGSPSAGGSAVAGTASGGAADAGSANGGAGAGAGGKVPDSLGGSPNSQYACSAPYAGPSGGPRADGPMALSGCQTIADDVVLARYNDDPGRVPRGLYYEPTFAFWHEPCSKSAEETVARGPTDGRGTFVESYSNEWFYEAVYCFDNSLRRVERNLRCDYFDGTKLAMPSPERLAFLASLLWWGEYGNSDDVLSGYSVTIGDATDVVELCTISTVHGDFGLCDEVRLETTRHLLSVDGTVKLGTPELIRTLKGDCH
jgi:hypothetical protein